MGLGEGVEEWIGGRIGIIRHRSWGLWMDIGFNGHRLQILRRVHQGGILATSLFLR